MNPEPDLTNTRLAEQQLANERDRLQLLLDINNVIVSHLSLRDLLQAISACLRRVISHDFAGIALYDAESNVLRAHTLEFQPNQDIYEKGAVLPIKGTPPGLAFRKRQTVLIRSYDPAEFPAAALRPAIDAGLKSAVNVPLIFQDRCLGTLDIASFRDEAFNEADADLLTQVGKQIAIAVANALAVRELEALKNKLAEEKLYLEEEIQTAYNFEQIIGSSAALKRILSQVATVAPTDSTVLICGETGTGKELIARAIHHLSPRRERTLVKVNCAAIPMGLLESELFGHEKGAFTGAISQRIGRFELANRGTLFLDEVGDIPLELQPKLLRVLQEQEFERLGSTRTQKVDVRLVAATNCDLEKMVADKQFRRDLYYRLNVFPVTVPPLRERPEDIELLVRFFAQRFAQRMKKQIETIPSSAFATLINYDWPGNVRELENLIERAVILSRGTVLEIPISELKLPIKAEAEVEQSPLLESAEREHIRRVLEATNWVIGGPAGAAARLGVKRTTLQSKIRKLGISRQE